VVAVASAALLATSHGPSPAQASTSPRLPTALIGTWDSAEGSVELIYVFRSSGTYVHVGVVLQERASGLFSFVNTARGTVTVRGRVLLLRPRSGTQTLRDPDVPSRNYRRPISKKSKRYRWSIAGFGRSARLTLVDRTGNAVTYKRQ
jgi:hypothetical protein